MDGKEFRLPRSASMPHAPGLLATLVRDGFADYNARFATITRRARQRFEQRDWAAASTDAVERIELYDLCVTECMARLQILAGNEGHQQAIWRHVRQAFAAQIEGLIDGRWTTLPTHTP